MNARDLTRLAGIALVVWAIYLFTQPVTSGSLQCGSVIAPKSAGQGLAAIFTEAACANARSSAQTLAIVVAIAGALTILASVYFRPAREHSGIAQAGPGLPAAPLLGRVSKGRCLIATG